MWHKFVKWWGNGSSYQGPNTCPENICTGISLYWEGCSSMGRAGRLLIRRLPVQIPAPGWAELHVEVSLSNILNPKLLLICSWQLAWRLLTSVKALQWTGVLSREYPALAQRQLGLAPAKPLLPHKRNIEVTDDGWIFPLLKKYIYPNIDPSMLPLSLPAMFSHHLKQSPCQSFCTSPLYCIPYLQLTIFQSQRLCSVLVWYPAVYIGWLLNPVNLRCAQRTVSPFKQPPIS